MRIDAARRPACGSAKSCGFSFLFSTTLSLLDAIADPLRIVPFFSAGTNANRRRSPSCLRFCQKLWVFFSFFNHAFSARRHRGPTPHRAVLLCRYQCESTPLAVLLAVLPKAVGFLFFFQPRFLC